jgi:hypothetical protein
MLGCKVYLPLSVPARCCLHFHLISQSVFALTLTPVGELTRMKENSDNVTTGQNIVTAEGNVNIS